MKQVVQNSKRHPLPNTDTTLVRLVLCYGESSTLMCTRLFAHNAIPLILFQVDEYRTAILAPLNIERMLKPDISLSNLYGKKTTPTLSIFKPAVGGVSWGEGEII